MTGLICKVIIKLNIVRSIKYKLSNNSPFTSLPPKSQPEPERLKSEREPSVVKKTRILTLTHAEAQECSALCYFKIPNRHNHSSENNKGRRYSEILWLTAVSDRKEDLLRRRWTSWPQFSIVKTTPPPSPVLLLRTALLTSISITVLPHCAPRWVRQPSDMGVG